MVDEKRSPSGGVSRKGRLAGWSILGVVLLSALLVYLADVRARSTHVIATFTSTISNLYIWLGNDTLFYSKWCDRPNGPIVRSFIVDRRTGQTQPAPASWCLTRFMGKATPGFWICVSPTDRPDSSILWSDYRQICVAPTLGDYSQVHTISLSTLKLLGPSISDSCWDRTGTRWVIWLVSQKRLDFLIGDRNGRVLKTGTIPVPSSVAWLSDDQNRTDYSVEFKDDGVLSIISYPTNAIRSPEPFALMRFNLTARSAALSFCALPMHPFETTAIQAFQRSPDGRRIAWLLTGTPKSTWYDRFDIRIRRLLHIGRVPRPDCSLWLSDAAGRHMEMLSLFNSEGGVNDLQWSPNGKAITY